MCLNPEYVDEDKNNPDAFNLGFTSDGMNVVEITIRKKDAFRFGRMLIEKSKGKR